LDDDCQAEVGGVSVSLPKGEHTLTDDQAHLYIRHRDHSEFDSATTRLNRQKKYIAAFLSKLKEETAKDITVPLRVYNELSPYIVTDITTSEMTYMVSNTYNYKFDFENIYSLQGTTVIGKTEHEEFNYDPDQLYDMIIDIFYEKVR
jgi:anionic cell wall polymer biosynthesis LytR-Cps2A-Psr (LCP) family protein